MKITYHHTFGPYTPPPHMRKRTRRAFTMVMSQLPTIHELLQLARSISEGNKETVDLALGFAVVHPNDQFNRKVGTGIAEANRKPTTAIVRAIAFKIGGGALLMLEHNGVEFAIDYVSNGRPTIEPAMAAELMQAAHPAL